MSVDIRPYAGEADELWSLKRGFELGLGSETGGDEKRAKYAEKLTEVEQVDPSVRDQIEIEVLPQVLRMISDAHRQLEAEDGSGETVSDIAPAVDADSE